MQMQVGNGIETGSYRSDCNVGMEKPSSNQAISDGFHTIIRVYPCLEFLGVCGLVFRKCKRAAGVRKLFGGVKSMCLAHCFIAERSALVGISSSFCLI